MFYRAEAGSLGHVLLLWIGPGVWIRFSFGFSRTVESASDTQEHKVLYPPLNPISRPSDFGEKDGYKDKTTLPDAPRCVTGVSYVAI